MHTWKLPVAVAALAMACTMAACNRNTDNAPAPKTDAGASSPSSGAVGGPGSTEGGLKGEPSGGTPGGAATSSTPEGPPPGAGINQTDQGGLAGRPTESPSGSESRPNEQAK